MLGILGFQPIYKVRIGNYLVPTCHLPPPCALSLLLKLAGHGGGKGMTIEGVRRYYVQKNYASLIVPCPTPSPSSDILSLYSSIHVSSLLPTSSLYLSALSFSFTFSIFTSTLPLSCSFLYPFSPCLPPLFRGNMASLSLCEK